MPTTIEPNPTPTRRIALRFSVAAIAAGLAAPAPAANADADAALIALADRIMALCVEMDRISDEIEEMPIATRADETARMRRHDDEIYPLVDTSFDLRSQLAEMKATTLDGFRAKARVVQEYSNCSPGCADQWNDDAMAWSLANDLLGVPSVWRSDENGSADA